LPGAYKSPKLFGTALIQHSFQMESAVTLVNLVLTSVLLLLARFIFVNYQNNKFVSML